MNREALRLITTAALAAAVTVWYLVRPAALTRLRPPAGNHWPDWLPNWLQARPDAWPVGPRWAIGGFAGFCLTFGLSDLGGVSLALGLVAVPVTAIALGRLERGHNRDRMMLLKLQTPGALDAIAACLEAGLPLRQAVSVVAQLSEPEISSHLGRVVQGISVGLTDAQAWSGLDDDPVLGPVAREVARATDWGTAVGSLLSDYAQEMRRDTESEAKVRARAVGPRTVLPLSLCYLPAFVLLGLVPMVASGLVSVIDKVI
ncbi:MAG: type II secretion system F family protein [Propionibacteriaceae bacterium]|nr:type II secretion system F family protein [Propionibacteriaceae bacterium]